MILKEPISLLPSQEIYLDQIRVGRRKRGSFTLDNKSTLREFLGTEYMEKRTTNCKDVTIKKELYLFLLKSNKGLMNYL